MKKIHFLIFAILFIITNQLQSQQKAAPKLEWAKRYGGSKGQIGYCIKQTKDGGFINIGTTNSCDLDITKCYGSNDIWITKLGINGTIEWQKTYGGTDLDEGYSICETSEGGYIFSGSTRSNDGDVSGLHVNGFYNDAWVVKIDHRGNIEWQKCIGGSYSDWGSTIKQLPNGDFAMAGVTHSFDGDLVGRTGYPQNADYWLVVLKPNGEIRWSKTYGGNGDDDLGGMIVTNNNKFLLYGASGSNDGDVSGNHGNADGWIVKLNDTGKIEWQKCIGGSYYESIRDAVQTNLGDYMLSGATASNDGDINGQNPYGFKRNVVTWVVRIKESGAIVWQRLYGGSKDNGGVCLAQIANKDFMLGSVTSSSDGDITNHHGNNWYDIWLTHVNDTGTIVWQQCFGGTETDRLQSMTNTNDGGFIITGVTNSNDGDVVPKYPTGLENIWILKFGFNNSLDSISNSPQISIFPNPAHNFLNIINGNFKQFRIIDALGRNVYHPSNFQDLPSTFSTINIQNLASGIYWIELLYDNNIKKVYNFLKY